MELGAISHLLLLTTQVLMSFRTHVGNIPGSRKVAARPRGTGVGILQDCAGSPCSGALPCHILTSNDGAPSPLSLASRPGYQASGAHVPPAPNESPSSRHCVCGHLQFLPVTCGSSATFLLEKEFFIRKMSPLYVHDLASSWKQPWTANAADLGFGRPSFVNYQLCDSRHLARPL